MSKPVIVINNGKKRVVIWVFSLTTQFQTSQTCRIRIPSQKIQSGEEPKEAWKFVGMCYGLKHSIAMNTFKVDLTMM